MPARNPSAYRMKTTTKPKAKPKGRSSEPLNAKAKAVKKYEEKFTPAERRAISEYVRATNKSKAASKKAATNKRVATRRATNSGRRR